MNSILKTYLLIISQLILGVVILIATQLLQLPGWLHVSVIVFFSFLLLNLLHLYIFRLQNELKEYWSLRKIPFALLGISGGIIIAIFPTATALAAGQLQMSEISFSDISMTSLGLTFIIISWEELWFRGLFLNYCQKHLSVINISLTIGFLFMLVHILNPKIDLISTGPTLFFAGALLTILYFYYKTIWLPLGLHFGNNFTASVLETSKESDILFGNEGYISAFVLALLFAGYLIKIRNKTGVSGQLV